MRALDGLLVSTLAVMLASCGVSRPPLPPSLHLPQPVQDLKASRKGHKVTLTWTIPQESTDQEPLREHMGGTRICREVAASSINACSRPLAELTRNQLSITHPGDEAREAAPQATFTDQLTPELEQQNPSTNAVYAVEVLNADARSAGVSNLVQIPLAPIPEPPSDIATQVTAEAVLLRFSATTMNGVEPRLGMAPSGGENVSNYRVYRTVKDTNNLVALGLAQIEDHKLLLEDRTFEWETSYEYKITPLTWNARGAEIEGDDSRPVEVFTHDIFPPTAPTGLQAVSSGTAREKFIDLTWAPNTESDLAGYNLYRREPGVPAERINTQLITTPAFRDPHVQVGKTYIYAVSAVDLRRNESPRSEEASEVVP
jgi:hypothetical protein